MSDAPISEPRDLTVRPYPCSPSTAKLAAALAKAQAAFLPAKKANTAKIEGKDGKRGYEYSYADFSELVAATRPALTANGLAVSHSTVLRGNGMLMVCTLEHESGEWKAAEWPMASLPSIQNMGSLASYLRRYTYQGIIGLMPQDQDDDGAAANQYDTSYKAPKPAAKPKSTFVGLDHEQRQAIVAALTEVGANTKEKAAAILESIGGWSGTAEIPKGEYVNVLDALASMPRPGEEGA